jgi:hypothetical protein
MQLAEWKLVRGRRRALSLLDHLSGRRMITLAGGGAGA